MLGRTMLVVGLTGGIGSGKTTVAELFAAHGVPVVDTDALARELVHPGEPAHADIAREFGADVLDAAGALDRAKMRALVFKNPLERKRLEAILHPRIREATRHRLAALSAPYAIVAVPLLVETGFDDLVDRILVVDCDERLQVARVAARNGMGEEEIHRVMAAQTSRQQRLAHADEVLENDADLAQLQRNVDRLHKHYLSLASA